MKVNINLKRSIISIFVVVIFVSLISVITYAESITGEQFYIDAAFTGFDKNGNFLPYTEELQLSVDEYLGIGSDYVTGNFDASSYISAVNYFYKKDGSNIVDKGDVFTFSFTNFFYFIIANRTYYCESFDSMQVVLMYEDGTYDYFTPEYSYSSSTYRSSFTGSVTAQKNVYKIKLDLLYHPTTRLGISGSWNMSFNMGAHNAGIKIDIQSEEAGLLEGIGNQIGSAINGTPEQNHQAQDAIGGLNSSTDKLGDLGDQMASVEKPTIDSNKISAGSLVPSTSLAVLSSPFQALWESEQLLAMLTIVVTLVLLSWVFFGKKG